MDVSFLNALLTISLFFLGITIPALYRMIDGKLKETSKFILRANAQEDFIGTTSLH